MSKCKTVQDEKKIHEIVIRRKEGTNVIEKRVLPSPSEENPGLSNEDKHDEKQVDSDS